MTISSTSRPELRAAALEIVKQYVIGPMFTPPSIKGTGPTDTKGTIQLPGSVGGADWQGGAFDPETGLLYVPSITGPFVADIIPGNPKDTNLRFTRGTREYPPAPLGLPLREAAVRADHGHRSQSRRDRLDGRRMETAHATIRCSSR